jgi:hypothetical protein
VRHPYPGWYAGRTWRWQLSWDGGGRVLQVNLGRAGLTFPLPWGHP